MKGYFCPEHKTPIFYGIGNAYGSWFCRLCNHSWLGIKFRKRRPNNYPRNTDFLDMKASKGKCIS